MRRLKPHWPQCLARRKRCARQDGGCSPVKGAQRGLTVFAVFGAIVLPLFTVASPIFKTAAGLTACVATLSAVVLGLLLIVESNSQYQHGARRGVIRIMALLFTVIGLGSLVIAMTELDLGAPTDDKTIVRRGSSFRVGGDPTRIVVGRDGVLWVGDRKASIRSLDASLRQPLGAPRRIGRRLLHDLEMIGGFLFALVDEGKVVRVDPSPTGGPQTSQRYGGGGGGEIIPDGSSFWVNDRSSARVFRFSLDLKQLRTIVVNPNPMARATAIAAGGDGFLWVADGKLNNVYKVSTVTEKVVLSKAVLERPESLLVIGGILFVAHPSLGMLELIQTADGERLPGVVPIDLGPTLLVTARNFLLVCSSKTSQLSPYSSTGEPVGQALPVGVSPTDIDFGPDGEGWAVDSARGEVVQLELQGTRKGLSRANARLR